MGAVMGGAGTTGAGGAAGRPAGTQGQLSARPVNAFTGRGSRGSHGALADADVDVDVEADPGGPPVRLSGEAEPPMLAELRRLVLAARLGEAEAKADLLARLAPLVRGSARRAARRAQRLGLAMDGEDLIQEAQAMLLSLMAQCDPALGPPLLFFTLRLRARLNQYVQAQARRRLPGRRLGWDDRPGQDVAEALSVRLFSEANALASSGGEAALYEALDRLTARQKRLLYLFYWRRLSDSEVARALRLSAPAARQARYRTLAALRLSLEAAGFGKPAALVSGSG